MFDVSLGEIGIVVLIGLLVLGPSEMISLLKSTTKIISQVKKSYNDFIRHLNDELEDDQVVKIIFDEEGNPQKAYDVARIMPYIKDGGKRGKK